MALDSGTVAVFSSAPVVICRRSNINGTYGTLSSHQHLRCHGAENDELDETNSGTMWESLRLHDYARCCSFDWPHAEHLKLIVNVLIEAFGFGTDLQRREHGGRRALSDIAMWGSAQGQIMY